MGFGLMVGFILGWASAFRATRYGMRIMINRGDLKVQGRDKEGKWTEAKP
jgi:hypothetical protein